MTLCGNPHPSVDAMTCTLEPHSDDTNHLAERVETVAQLQPDPKAPQPLDANGDPITHDIDGNPLVPLVYVDTLATVTYRWT